MIKYRHGDVDIFTTDKIPSSAKELNNTILALGEVTGHHHTVYPLGDTKVTVYQDTDTANLVDKYIKIEGGQAVLKHQEHETIVLDPGVYETKIEQEFNPFEREYKRVID